MTAAQLVPISEFCRTGSGTTPSRQKAADYYSGSIPWVKSGELRESEITETKEHVTEQALTETSLRLIPAGALLVAMYGATVGRVGLLGVEATTNQAVCHVIPDPKRADTRYMFHALQEKAQELVGKGVGGAQPNISQGVIKETKIFLPPLDEQKRIAAILDQADALCCLRSRVVERLNTLGQSIFYEMFGDPKTNSRGWQQVKLGDVASFYSGNSLPEGEEFKGQLKGYLLLKVSDLNHPENTRRIDVSAFWSDKPGSRAGTCPATAVVFPKRGGAIATNKKRLLPRAAILDPNLMGVVPQSDVMHSEFLFGWFDTFNLSDIASGSSVPQLNKQDLAPLELFLPPIKLQEKYYAHMTGLVELFQKARHAHCENDRLFAALQQRAFGGEL